MIHNIYIMYHRIGNSALETLPISAEGYELAKDVAVTAAGVTAVGKLAKAGLGIGDKIRGKLSGSSGIGTEKKSTNKTNNTNDNSQQNESTHNNSLINSISDVNQAIEQTRSSKDNYTKKLEKNKQITLNKHL